MVDWEWETGIGNRGLWIVMGFRFRVWDWGFDFGIWNWDWD